MLPRRFGDYELLQELGRGGMGVVYKARQVSLNRVVALKVIRADKVTDLEPEARRDWLRRFQNEAEAVADLDHPNIVAIHHVGEAEGRPFFSMKLLEGGSLKDCLGRYPDDPRAAARLVAAVARAVHHAHQLGILHRDLKPGNILLDDQGRPYVTDFGLVKRLDRGETHTQTGALLGTPEYMAPEQARAEKRPTTAVDVYSLGALLYALLVGAPPFRGDTILETLRQLQEQAPDPPRGRNAKVDRDLETICLQCLAKEPEGRYGSAEAVAEDLENWLAARPISARPAGRLERAVKWVRRRPGVAALLAACALALAGGGGFSTYFAIQSSERAQQAEQNARQAQSNEQAAHAAREELESTLAGNLFRPIGQKPEPLEPLEREALWELSTLTNDRVRVRFLEKALENGEAAARLTRRLDLAVHAAVGLDQRRRQQVRRALLGRLHDRGDDDRVAAARVHVGVALGEEGSAFKRKAVRTLFASMDRPADPLTLPLQARALRALADQLDSGQAAKAVWIVLAPRAPDRQHATAHALAARELARAVKTLAGKVKRGQADTLARAIVVSFEQRSIDDRIAAAALLALATRLDRDQANQLVARAAASAVGRMHGEFYHPGSDSSAWAFQALTAWLGRDEAGRLAAEAGKRYVEQMGRSYFQLLPHLARAFEVVADRMDRAESGRLAAEAARVLVLQLEKVEGWECFWMTKAFQTVAGRLDQDEARRLASRAAQALAKRMVQPAPRHVLAMRARAFALLADRLDKGQTGRWVERPAEVLAERMGRETNSQELRFLTESFRALGGSLDRKHAARVAVRPAELLVERMGKSTSPYELEHLASAFAALAGGLNRDHATRLAAQAAQAIARRIDRTSDPAQLVHLVKAAQAVAGWLDQDQAARLTTRLTARATRAIAEKLGQTTRRLDYHNLALVCVELAGPLNGNQAGELVSHIVRAANRVFARPSNDLRPFNSYEERDCAKQAWERGMRCRNTSKPFIETLRVTKPVQESGTSTWKRVLRGGGVTRPAKRRQRALRPCD
jgi:predicted Ser/Thr protein kinase